MTSSDAERELLRETFDRASDLYPRVRPDDPPELFDRLLEVTQLRRGARLLEISCATGKATLPLPKQADGHRDLIASSARQLALWGACTPCERGPSGTSTSEARPSENARPDR